MGGADVEMNILLMRGKASGLTAPLPAGWCSTTEGCLTLRQPVGVFSRFPAITEDDLLRGYGVK
jgi:hypothetical protein